MNTNLAQNHTSPSIAASAEPKHATRWHKDISNFDHLLNVSRTIAEIQTVLMEYIRKGRLFLKSGMAPGQTCHDYSEQTIAMAEQKLAETDVRIASVRARMCLLERRILTHEPETAQEAATLVGFLARVMKAEIKVDTDYVSAILEGCAEVMGKPQTLAATKPYQQLAMI